MAGPFDFTQSDDRASDDPTLVVDVDGFEGPLDLLLELSRRQKVDLARISILALAEQYLAFIEAARKLRLELAADYLVMAAWLAYLKSRLLLPEPPKGEEPPAAELAAALAFRLKRLEAMRTASESLQGRPQLGREVFFRGMPEGVRRSDAPRYEATLYDLLSAYARQRQRSVLARVRLPDRNVWTLAEARELLERLVGPAHDWTSLTDFLLDYLADPATRATVKASSFSASLELAKEGRLDLRQDKAFAPIYIRGRGARGRAGET
ncbi:segregation and condensation protein A [Labrys wisconsinensis]|uniref:Segregation and condensation protein A n=1 Tax=Labrys wisconsinensis TaxID=425677 RepID=A0ABU0J3C7_9HYPH|nr:ScpA family protein [Labrys wisconsinensis]MDQ0468768.1 segregation and condensation protein A [Labrys wisconsinensis]